MAFNVHMFLKGESDVKGSSPFNFILESSDKTLLSLQDKDQAQTIQNLFKSNSVKSLTPVIYLIPNNDHSSEHSPLEQFSHATHVTTGYLDISKALKLGKMTLQQTKELDHIIEIAHDLSHVAKGVSIAAKNTDNFTKIDFLRGSRTVCEIAHDISSGILIKEAVTGGLEAAGITVTTPFGAALAVGTSYVLKEGYERFPWKKAGEYAKGFFKKLANSITPLIHEINPVTGLYPNNMNETLLEFYRKNKKTPLGEAVRKSVAESIEQRAQGSQLQDPFLLNCHIFQNCLGVLSDSKFSTKERNDLFESVRSFQKENNTAQSFLLDEGYAFTQQYKFQKPVVDFGNVFLSMVQSIKKSNQSLDKQRDFEKMTSEEQIKAIEGMKTELVAIKKEIVGVKVNQEQMKEVADYVFEAMTDVSKSETETNKKIQEMRKDLELYKTLNPTDKKGILEKTEALRKEQSIIDQKRLSFNATIEGFRGVLSLGNMIATDHNCPEAATLFQAGDSVCTIIGGIGTLAGWGIPATIGGPFFPLLAIAGGSYCLYRTLFLNTREDPSKILLKSIQAISKQLSELEVRLDKRVIELHKHMEHLNGSITIFHQEAFNWFIILHSQIDLIESKLEKIEGQNKQTAKLIEDFCKSQKLELFEITKEKVLKFHRLAPWPTHKKTATDLVDYWQQFYRTAIKTSKDDFCAGRDLLRSATILDLQEELSKTRIEDNIHLIVQQANQLGLKQINRLFNLVIWAEGSVMAVELANMMPEFHELLQDPRAKSEYIDNLDTMISAGLDFEQFILNLKTNRNLFKKLIEDGYISSLQKVVVEVKTIIQKTSLIGAKIDRTKELKNYLQELDGHHKLLSAFLTLAFKTDSINNPVFIEHVAKFWDRDIFENYLAAYKKKNSTDDKTFISALEKDLHDGVVEAKKYIQSKVDEAAKESDSGNLKAAYPLIYHVIVVLEQFKSLTFPNTTPLKRPSKATFIDKEPDIVIPLDLPIAFGKELWSTHLGDIGIEPPIPLKKIKDLLKTPCPFYSQYYPDKKIEDTHILFVLPKSVNGKLWLLQTLGEMIQKPLKGTPTKFGRFNLGQYINSSVENSYWILMTRECIPGSYINGFQNQQNVLQSFNEKSGLSYEIPSTLEVATCIMIEYLRTGTPLFSYFGGQSEFSSRITCPEKYDQNNQLGIGFDPSTGLNIDYSRSIGRRPARPGIAAALKFY